MAVKQNTNKAILLGMVEGMLIASQLGKDKTLDLAERTSHIANKGSSDEIAELRKELEKSLNAVRGWNE